MKRSPTHQRLVMLGEHTYRYTLRRSRRARHLLLHVHFDGAIEVVVPYFVSLKRAEAFVADRRAWIGRTLAKYQQQHRSLPQRKFISGEQLPCGGDLYTLRIMRPMGRQRAHLATHEKIVTLTLPPSAAARPYVVRWYQQQARRHLTPLAQAFAASVGKNITRLVIGDTRTQWGSCSPRGRLAFNWRLLLAPAPIAAYVVAHEVAHLRHPNHSSSFWQLVSQLDRRYASARQWLKLHGRTLVL